MNIIPSNSCSQNIGIIYYWQPYNKINGSLFYAYEYFVQLKELNCLAEFYIIGNLSVNDKKLIEKAFSIKYKKKFYSKYSPIFLDSILKLKKIKFSKTFLVDIKSYNKVSFLLDKETCHLYCDDLNKIKNVLFPKFVYGYYSYQYYNIKVPLKLNFKIFKKIKNRAENNLTFVSSLYSKEHEIEKYFPKDYVYKIHNKFLNIFEQFNKFLYIHNGHQDTNNRLIPECFFYKMNLDIIFIKEKYKNDSIFERYNECFSNGFKKYELNETDIIISNLRI